MGTVRTRLTEDAIGTRLRAERESRGLLKEDVALSTKIPAKYLTLFEEALFEELPDDAYTRIYLKAYAKFLGMDVTKAVSAFLAEREAALPQEIEPTTRRHHPTASLRRSAFAVTPRRIRNVLIALLLVGMAAYVALSIERVVAPPNVTVLSPSDGLVTMEKSVTIRGATVREAVISVNGKQVAPDADGNFRDELALREGVNHITVTASRKHSKPMTVTRRVIVEPTPTGMAAATGIPVDGAGL